MSQTQKTSFQDLIASSEPVLIDFWAPWCGPCQRMNPSIKQLAAETKGRLKVIKINVDNNPAVAQAYSIQSVPTLVIFKEGKLLARQAGALSEPQLKAFVAPYI